MPFGGRARTRGTAGASWCWPDDSRSPQGHAQERRGRQDGRPPSTRLQVHVSRREPGGRAEPPVYTVAVGRQRRVERSGGRQARLSCLRYTPTPSHGNCRAGTDSRALLQNRLQIGTRVREERRHSNADKKIIYVDLARFCNRICVRSQLDAMGLHGYADCRWRMQHSPRQ